MGASNGWIYNQRPRTGRYPGGTGNGGVVYSPPEVDIGDIGDDYAPAGVTKSRSYVTVAPGAFFAAGVPYVQTGDIAKGYRWGIDSSRNLVYTKMAFDATAVDVFKLTQTKLGQFVIGDSTSFANLIGVLGRNLTVASSAATGGEQTLRSITIPANALKDSLTTGQGIRIRAWGDTGGNTNSKTINLYVGVELVMLNDVTVTPNGDHWMFEAIGFMTDFETLRLNTTGIVGAVWQSTFSSSVIWSDSAQTVSITATAPTAAGDVRVHGMVVEMLS